MREASKLQGVADVINLTGFVTSQNRGRKPLGFNQSSPKGSRVGKGSHKFI